MQENEQLNPEELQVSKLATLPVDPTASEEMEKVLEAVEEVVDTTEEDLDKRNYLKITPTFYVQGVENEDEDSEEELFKILNPETGVVETRELTDDEKKEFLVSELKKSRKRFDPLSNPTKTVGMSTVVSSIGRERKIKEKAVVTNETVNQFGDKYKQKRKRRNKMAKASRKANR